jgi:UDP-N-acetylmuramate dehydrogenase
MVTRIWGEHPPPRDADEHLPDRESRWGRTPGVTAPPLSPDVPLHPLTTLGVGGPACGLARARDLSELRASLERADADGVPVLLLGGGSNIVVADRRLEAHAIQYDDDRIDIDATGRLKVGAGHDWDGLVSWAVDRDLAGIECLSGIPGRVGAAPIQNIGAYGQEVAEVISAVEALDRTTGEVRRFAPQECRFGYRTSRFKHDEPGRWIVTAIELDLKPGGAPSLRYADLQRRAGPSPSLSAVRELVLGVRREKSMVLSRSDPNARSAGSFFTNPIVAPAVASVVAEAARVRGIDTPMPRWPAGDRVKLAAAWLIEQAGFSRGYGDGPAGLSERHTLAIVNRGGATARDVVELAATIRRGVRDAFGVQLVPEPVFVGFLGPCIDDSGAVLDAIDAGDL